jgi:hypothetical protein
MLRPTRLLHFDHPDGPSLAKLARSRTQPAQHSHSGPGLVRPVHAPTRGPRPYGPGPLQTQRALLPCCHSRPGARLPKSLPACSLYALGSLALHLSQPFCTLLLGFIGLALSRPGYHPLRRVHWRPASPSAYLARVLRSQLEPARFIFSASGTRCKPLHRGPLAFKWGHRLTNGPTHCLPLPINGCCAKPIVYLPAWGASRCRHPTPRGAVGDRVNDKPVNPGHLPAPHAPSTLVNPSSPAKSARRAWHALRPPFCCSPPGMKMGSDSPGQLVPFPYKPRSGRARPALLTLRRR